MKVLICDDEEMTCRAMSELFARRGIVSRDVSSFKETLKALRQDEFDLLILDVLLPDANGVDALPALKAEFPELFIIVITGQGSIAQSVEAVRKGAADYLKKPLNFDEVLLRVEKVFETQRLRAQLPKASKMIVGASPAMKKLHEQLATIAQSSSATVLITGETGTGKEVVARSLHELSPRSKKPFVEVNASSLHGELLESELFGHEMGAFTGATKTKRGLFEVAHGGTLFLDEIGEMDMRLQARLLRALQERIMRRVGGLENIAIDVRLIAATNRNLPKAVQEGIFREDLYFRLNVIGIEIPPLRNRLEDLPAFLERFVAEFNVACKKSIESVDAGVYALLSRHTWPGNVRELRNTVERIMLLSAEGKTLTVDAVLAAAPQFRTFEQESPQQRQERLLAKVKELGANIPLEQIERDHIAGVLKNNDWNKNRCAKILGIDRSTLYNKLKKYKLESKE